MRSASSRARIDNTKLPDVGTSEGADHLLGRDVLDRSEPLFGAQIVERDHQNGHSRVAPPLPGRKYGCRVSEQAHGEEANVQRPPTRTNARRLGRNRGDEAVATTGHRFDEAWRACVVAQDVADSLDAPVEALFEVDVDLRAPDVALDLGARYQLAWARRKELENPRGLRLQVETYTLPDQVARVGELEFGEADR